ncbi:hypothetical protein [Pseudomonas multiresinivorans]|uniref:Uncharacterized protein n=1 Tax=Pseudomonas multiresinivorans TaxID=95301 RepID=A0A7Z3BKK2_9PSED|nr:hypothetical protein [Pseudomonas multiresinivorans]QJP08622.1 hypothetical protein G4G71_12295 [Pseudomonas multiresinivorans]
MPKFLPKGELQALSLKAEGDGLTLNDLSTIGDKFGAAPQDLLNELSVWVAENYLQGSLDFDFCDSVMNGIINAVVEVGMTSELPQPAFSLYQAFDQGEWIRNSDSPEIDPSEKYTRPMILEILRVLKD